MNQMSLKALNICLVALCLLSLNEYLCIREREYVYKNPLKITLAFMIDKQNTTAQPLHENRLPIFTT